MNAPFFSQLWFDFWEFIYSFMTDYQSIGNMEISSEEPLTVWIASGRDQAQIIRNMIQEDFTPQTGIPVSLQLVAAGTLLPATVAGIGPDVNIGGTDVINFAMRNAVRNLSEFSDCATVMERFAPAILIPATYNGGIYGIPETMSFSVLFYRKDILEELNLTVPTTWDEVIKLSSVLAKNKMEFGLPFDCGTYLQMLKQKGMEVYDHDGAHCILDNEASIILLRYYANFYLNHGLPLSYDFVNRFRTGEMPIGVADFATYATLELSAPEIRGLWDFALIPGMEREDGSVDHSAMISGNYAVILKANDRAEDSWAFLKWYTDTPAQVTFGREIESLLGPSARYSSANLEAFAQSEWSADNLKLLQEQLAHTTAIEQVPGSYFLSRHLNNSLRHIVYNGKDPLDMQYDYVYKINGELTEKREEFGLTVYTGE